MLPSIRTAGPTAPSVILGLDPSIAAYGWAFVRIGAPLSVVAAGCVRTAVDDEDAYVFEKDGQRIDDLARAIGSVIDTGRTYGRLVVAFEVPGGSKSLQAARFMAMSYTLTRTLIVARALPSIPLRAAEVKVELTGDREAEKPVVARCIEKAIGWRSTAATTIDGEAESDAVAIAITGARRLRAEARA